MSIQELDKLILRNRELLGSMRGTNSNPSTNLKSAEPNATYADPVSSELDDLIDELADLMPNDPEIGAVVKVAAEEPRDEYRFLSTEEFNESFYKSISSLNSRPGEEKRSEAELAEREPAKKEKPAAEQRIEPGRKKANKKKLHRLGNTIFYLAIAAVFAVSFTYLSEGNGTRPFLGFSLYEVLTDSMESAIPQGSMVVAHKTDAQKIEIGDDITYLIGENSSITHRVIGIIENYENTGARAFETMGVDNEKPDQEAVWAKNVIGKVIFHVPRAGKILNNIKEHWLLLLLPLCGILIFASLLKFVFTKERSEEKQSKKRNGLFLNKAKPNL